MFKDSALVQRRKLHVLP